MDAPPLVMGLPRSRRIKQGRDFARAKTEGNRLTQGCLILNWLVVAPGTGCRVGVITSRRIGDAVRRSRARRLLREAFRLHQDRLLHPVDVVLVARASIVGKTYAEVAQDFVAALRKARLLRES
jgi:ribonuclease P protein component